MAKARYFKLIDSEGIEPDWITNPADGQPVENPAKGELSPIEVVGIPVATPTMIDGELVGIGRTINVSPIPGTRVIKLDDPAIANAFTAHPHYIEIPPVTEKQLERLRKDTEAARNRVQSIPGARKEA